MARKKTSAADDVMTLVAMLPWWVGALLAGLLYFGLHHLANRPVAAATQLGQMDALFTQTMVRALASFGQYLLPFLCLVGAAGSALRRRERRQLVANVAGSKAADALDGMTWQQFERLVGEAFRLRGYDVTETGGGGADGGIDLVLRKDGEKYLVQCKQWRAFKVGVSVVRELYGAMAAQGAAGGFVVTSGRFTVEARNFAKGRNVDLIDGARLRVFIAQSAGSPRQIAAHADVRNSATAVSTSTRPACPVCSKPMVRRVAKRGSHAGEAFWGCSGYPSCRGKRPID